MKNNLPGIYIREKEVVSQPTFTDVVATGAILPSNQGEALIGVPVRSQEELIDKFGYPDSYNEKFWWNCYNYLNYAESLIISRPIKEYVNTVNNRIQIQAGTNNYNTYADSAIKTNIKDYWFFELASSPSTNVTQYIDNYNTIGEKFQFTDTSASAIYSLTTVSTWTEKTFLRFSNKSTSKNLNVPVLLNNNFNNFTFGFWFTSTTACNTSGSGTIFKVSSVFTFDFSISGASTAGNSYFTLNVNTSIVSNTVQKVGAVSPTGTYTSGLSYIVASSGITFAAWSGKETQLAEYNTSTSSWDFTSATITGWLSYSQTNSTTYYFNGSAWIDSSDNIKTSADSIDNLQLFYMGYNKKNKVMKVYLSNSTQSTFNHISSIYISAGLSYTNTFNFVVNSSINTLLGEVFTWNYENTTASMSVLLSKYSSYKYNLLENFNTPSTLTYTEENSEGLKMYNRDIAQKYLIFYTIATTESTDIEIFKRDLSTEENVAVSICSDTNLLDIPVTPDCINIFDSSNYSTKIPYTLNTFKNYFSLYELNNNEFLIIVFKKNKNGIWEFAEKHQLKTTTAESDIIENSNLIYIRINDKYKPKTSSHTFNVNTCNYNINQMTIRNKITSTTTYSIYSSVITSDNILKTASDIFDSDDYNVQILMGYDDGSEQRMNVMPNIAREKENCIAITGLWDIDRYKSNIFDSNELTSDIISDFNSVYLDFTNFSSYNAFYGNLKLQEDTFNEKNIWLPLIGDMAGLYTKLYNENDGFFAPAGNKTTIENIIDVMYRPSNNQKSSLINNKINPITFDEYTDTFNVVEELTTIKENSIFTDIHNRLTLIDIRNFLQGFLKPYLFTYNTKQERDNISIGISNKLQALLLNGNLQNYFVQCDEENNSPEMQNNNQLKIDIALQLSGVIKQILIDISVSKGELTLTETEI